MRRPSPYLLLKLAVTFGLLGVLAWQADLSRIGPLLATLDASLLALAIALQATAFLLSGVRWWLLLRHQLPTVAFRTVLPSYYMGVFANNVLPTSVGGDAARTLHLHLMRIPLEALVSSALVDRALGLASIVFVAGVALTAFPHDPTARQLGLAVLGLVAVGAVVAALALSRRALAWVDALAARFGERRLVGFLLRAVGDCQRYRSRPGLLLLLFALTLVTQSLVVVIYALLADGIGLAIGLGSLFYVVPIVLMAANLPISLGGLGVREGALVGLLALFGIATSAAVGLSLAYLVVLWLATLPGAVALVLLRREQAARAG